LLQRLNELKTLFIYATHFDKLKELGKQNMGLMNYKVDAPIKNSNGKLVYPYTLSPGASIINVAEDMAKEAGLFD
jgi:DNA mismatch repair ATPase MutS